MSRIDPFRAGLTLGLLFGGACASWIALVAFTAASWVTDVVVPGQIIRATFEFDGVDLSGAAFFVLMSSLAGCALGGLFSAVWNALADLCATGPVRQAGR